MERLHATWTDLASDRRRRHAEDSAEAVSEVTVTGITEVVGEIGEVRVGIRESVERVPQPQVIAVFVQAETRTRSEHAGQVVLRRVQPAADLLEREPLVRGLGENGLRLLHQVAMISALVVADAMKPGGRTDGAR